MKDATGLQLVFDASNGGDDHLLIDSNGWQILWTEIMYLVYCFQKKFKNLSYLISYQCKLQVKAF